MRKIPKRIMGMQKISNQSLSGLKLGGELSNVMELSYGDTKASVCLTVPQGLLSKLETVRALYNVNRSLFYSYLMHQGLVRQLEKQGLLSVDGEVNKEGSKSEPPP